MFMLIFIGIAIAVYLSSFKDDFSKEVVDKVVPFVFVICLIMIVLGLIGSSL